MNLTLENIEHMDTLNKYNLPILIVYIIIVGENKNKIVTFHVALKIIL